jgi:hypothetical protein
VPAARPAPSTPPPARLAGTVMPGPTGGVGCNSPSAFITGEGGVKQTADERDQRADIPRPAANTWHDRHRQEPQHWGIFLIAVGAILTFGVHATVARLDLHMIGWILMLAGAAGMILFFCFWNGRRPQGTVGRQPRGYDDTGQPPRHRLRCQPVAGRRPALRASHRGQPDLPGRRRRCRPAGLSQRRQPPHPVRRRADRHRHKGPGHRPRRPPPRATRARHDHGHQAIRRLAGRRRPPRPVVLRPAGGSGVGYRC